MMLNRTTPKRLTFIVLALILGILLGLALFPTNDAAGAVPSAFCDPVTQIPVVECEALEALYNSTNGASWTDNTGWLTSTLPCDDWYGITCVGDQVWQIGLSNNGLVGTIPAAIGNLSGLQILLLDQNQLTGPVPAELSQLTTLTRLNLSSNQLSGAFPAGIVALVNLRDLSLAYNQLEGQLPADIGDMTSLQLVELISNSIGGPLPATLGNLPLLEWLDVSQNAISGTVPVELGGANNLGFLYLASNQLQGTVPNTLCDSLQDISLAYNMIDPVGIDPCIDDVADPNWQATQTVAPGDLVAQSPAPGVVHLSWTPLSQLSGPGHYEILSSTTSGGPYTLSGQTPNKQVSVFTINGLDPTQQLFFTMRTITPANSQNQSDLLSPTGEEAPITPTAITLGSFTAEKGFPAPLWLLLAAALLALGSLSFLALRRARR